MFRTESSLTSDVGLPVSNNTGTMSLFIKHWRSRWVPTSRSVLLILLIMILTSGVSAAAKGNTLGDVTISVSCMLIFLLFLDFLTFIILKKIFGTKIELENERKKVDTGIGSILRFS